MESQVPPPRGGAGPAREPGGEPERHIGRAIAGFKIPWWVGLAVVLVVVLWLLVAGSSSRGVEHDLREVVDGATVVEFRVVTTDKVIDKGKIDIRESELHLEDLFHDLGAKRAEVRISRPRD